MDDCMPVSIWVDGTCQEAETGTNLCDVLLRSGYTFVKLCYHPHLSNQPLSHFCWVEIEIEGQKKIGPACTMEIEADMKISTKADEAVAARDKAFFYTAAYHPPECFSCEKNMNCTLQKSVAEHGFKSYPPSIVSTSYTHKQIIPYMRLYPDRCIECGKCIDFTEKVTRRKELLLSPKEGGVGIDITSHKIRPGLIGNLADICPAGAIVLEDRTGESSQAFPTLDLTDGYGAPLMAHIMDNQILSFTPREREASLPWISDLCRFSCDAQHLNRINTPFVRVEGALQPATWIDALKAVVRKVADCKRDEIAVLVGDLVDAETILLLKDLLDDMGISHRDLISRPRGVDHVHQPSFMMNVSLNEICESDLCLFVGNFGFEASALKSHIMKNIPNVACIGVEGFEEGITNLGPFNALEDLLKKTHKFTEQLYAAKRPIIIMHADSLTGEEGAKIYEKVQALSAELKIEDKWGLNVYHPSLTTVTGLSLGFRPQPGGYDQEQIERMVRGRRIKFLYLLNVEQFPFQSTEDTFIVYQGHHMDIGAKNADVIFPVCTPFESSATFLNTEGKILTVNTVVPHGHEARPGWKVIRALSEVLGYKQPYNTEADVKKALNERLSVRGEREKNSSEKSLGVLKRVYADRQPVLRNSFLRSSEKLRSIFGDRE